MIQVSPGQAEGKKPIKINQLHYILWYRSAVRLTSKAANKKILLARSLSLINLSFWTSETFFFFFLRNGKIGNDELFDSANNIWQAWHVRVFILLSLWVQTIFILFGPLRKSTSNTLITFLIWSAYLLADWAPKFSAGLMMEWEWQK